MRRGRAVDHAKIRPLRAAPGRRNYIFLITALVIWQYLSLFHLAAGKRKPERKSLPGDGYRRMSPVLRLLPHFLIRGTADTKLPYPVRNDYPGPG